MSDEDWGEEDGWGEVDGSDQDDQGDAEIPNNFYEAESMMKQQPGEALEKFEVVLMLEENAPNREFSFKATRFII